MKRWWREVGYLEVAAVAVVAVAGVQALVDTDAAPADVGSGERTGWVAVGGSVALDGGGTVTRVRLLDAYDEALDVPCVLYRDGAGASQFQCPEGWVPWEK